MVAHQVLLQPEKGFGLEGNRKKLAFGCFVVVSLLLFVVVLFVGLFCLLLLFFLHLLCGCSFLPLMYDSDFRFGFQHS